MSLSLCRLQSPPALYTIDHRVHAMASLNEILIFTSDILSCRSSNMMPDKEELGDNTPPLTVMVIPVECAIIIEDIRTSACPR